MLSQLNDKISWPKLRFTIVFLLLIIILTSLGLWQLQRANEKHTIEAVLKERSVSEILQVGEERLQLPDSEYRQGIAQGWFDNGHIIFLDNQIHKGRAGYHVLIPLRFNDGDGNGILVNFGWLPMELDRQELPQIEPPHLRVTAHGILRQPYQAPFFLGSEESSESSGWPKVVQYVSTEQLQSQLGYFLQPLILQLAPDEPYGFVRQWPESPTGVGQHVAYAVQWFALALIGLILSVILYRRNF